MLHPHAIRPPSKCGCVANWMQFIAKYKGVLAYDYNFGDRQLPKMTVDDIRQQVASLLS
jgi:hypothetical protein